MEFLILTAARTQSVPVTPPKWDALGRKTKSSRPKCPTPDDHAAEPLVPTMASADHTRQNDASPPP